MTARKAAPKRTKDAVDFWFTAFSHGGGAWFGVTIRTGDVLDKVMFTTKDAAEKYLSSKGFTKPRVGWQWKTGPDAYEYFRKG